ncbi:proteasome assembly chaperone family protein [Candidatus Laterigemmans baculatus]|uniref:proteasome assembly chaperone family protein n=1 Tax=Candidatus Laterigemmans baculatus TaxID=2770505 RepID=UPI0013DA992C|nr:PAC2 family protein [Candidatus Laterigemmans baculatus]
MDEPNQLNAPWLVAVWPGMGGVAVNAGIYLMAKLHMNLLAEFEVSELFDVDHVEVKDGIVQAGRRPRNRLYIWRDPKEKHDLVVFIGEAQPPLGKYAFCQKLMVYAQKFGIERVVTFAAWATQMHPEHEARVCGAATNEAALAELKRLDLEILEEGRIGGLNGVLLGAAADAKMSGICLLGEMPDIFSQLPFPKASRAILEVFSEMTGVEIDLNEISEQSQVLEQQLGELLAQVEETYGRQALEEEEEPEYPTSLEEETLDPADRRRIEKLFEESAQDRSRAFELKQELDRHGVFDEYEDRFLDLFKSPR